MTIQELIERIRAAFLDVELGDGITIHQAIVLDDRGDRFDEAKARRKDAGVHWTELTCETVQKCNSALSFLDEKGVRFYLPAFMICSLKGGSSLVMDAAIFKLMYEHGVSRRQTQPKNISAKFDFSPAQIRVIADFLEFLHPEEEGISEKERIVLSRWRALAEAQPDSSHG